ncbi:IS4 family transposase [Thalassotalea sp. LPB0316]|uniref:IS4 family transposase n=1 Tax=Thalassotalea sp. LPB0316 TaxID=2769490 RepID=UPI001866B58E|nr:IS4 family transposase [Thalassotalea sp. LPB0316]QOL24574.1 IS4 family transposase [Thalassotalea sp. LPB0316]QOL24681.1 IS4 family transposase [Thalassotalea sp. LPB0316]QOL26134.1 IS4 family transposase [Thalassotalea sp. LPB0316]QOL26847.1 IS4 family transposase [Thalassotalea sp. LPB0316]
MKVTTSLQQTFLKITNNIHAKRRMAIKSCVDSLLLDSFATVTSIGRGIDSCAYEKHSIKRADRLLSNAHLYRERVDIYREMTSLHISPYSRPLIQVDWSDLDNRKRNFLIRASVALDGRSITVYEEVHGMATKEKPATHKAFLISLAQVLPACCRPVIVTDGGFKVPWFKQILKLGWDFIGRIRGNNYYNCTGNQWLHISKLHEIATPTPKYFIGHITKTNPLAVNVVVYKSKSKGRKSLNNEGLPRKSKLAKQHAKSGREPWVLATSLITSSNTAKRIVELYKTRMQEEEAFRDVKSERYGFSLNLHLSYKTHRLNNLLLLTTIAHWLSIIVGVCGEISRVARRYQANTTRNKRVLSLSFLGRRLIRDKRFKCSKALVRLAFEQINRVISYWNTCDA